MSRVYEFKVFKQTNLIDYNSDFSKKKLYVMYKKKKTHGN